MDGEDKLWEKYWLATENEGRMVGLKILEEEAKTGNARIMFLLGQEYGVNAPDGDQNFEIAEKWFKRGMEGGDVPSKYEYGISLLKGLSGKSNPVEGKKQILEATLLENEIAISYILYDLETGKIGFQLSEFELHNLATLSARSNDS